MGHLQAGWDISRRLQAGWEKSPEEGDRPDDQLRCFSGKVGNILSAQGVNGGVLNDIANEKSWNMRDYSDWELPGFRANRGGSVCIQTDHIDSGVSRIVLKRGKKEGELIGM